MPTLSSQRVLSEFSALCQLLIRFDFNERVKGSHLFTRDGIDEIINL